MNTSTQTQQVEQQLRQSWSQVRHQILDEFPQLTAAEVDAARGIDDLVARIADLSRHSERYVETKLVEIAGQVGNNEQGQYTNGQTNGAQQAQPFGSGGNAQSKSQGARFAVSDA